MSNLADHTSTDNVANRPPRRRPAPKWDQLIASGKAIRVQSEAEIDTIGLSTHTQHVDAVSRKDDSGLIDELDAFVSTRIDLSPAQQTAVVLWIAHTYVFEHFKLTPKLFVTAIKHGLGKTETLEVVEALSRNGIKRQGSTTESAISRMYGKYGPFTLCLDQLDGMNWENRKLINLLCDGFEVGAIKEMSEVKGSNYEPQAFVVGFPQAMGMIGDLPDQALASRCITIRMQPADEERQRMLFEAQRTPLVDKLNMRVPTVTTARWRKRLADELAPRAEKWKAWSPAEAPCRCEPRMATMWQPLFAIADHFGGNWSERAQQAFCELASATEVKESKELTFLRHTMQRLPLNVPPVITPKELRGYVGIALDGATLAETDPGTYLGKVGAGSDVRRWKQRPNPNGGSNPWRGYEVAKIREAARRWKVLKVCDEAVLV